MIRHLITAATLASLTTLATAAENKCLTGKSQSPIDINGTEAAITYALDPQYNVTPLALENTGGALKLAYGLGSQLKVGSKSYDLMQVHIHTPSEHTVMGKSYPGEIHFVHGNKSRVWAVVAVLIQEGSANKAMNEVLTNLPQTSGETKSTPTVMVNGRDLMPHDKSYYRYMGSLTTGDCQEGVNWYVLKNPLELSSAQLQLLTSITGKNNRAIQPRNFRLIIDSQSK